MEIPDYLKEATESIVKGKELSKISKARETLTENYREREKEKNDFVNSPEERMAYIASRLPSIYSVVRSIFSDISGYDIKSLLDLGAGPGTVFFCL